jgi:hypothetical protein
LSSGLIKWHSMTFEEECVHTVNVVYYPESQLEVIDSIVKCISSPICPIEFSRAIMKSFNGVVWLRSSGRTVEKARNRGKVTCFLSGGLREQLRMWGLAVEEDYEGFRKKALGCLFVLVSAIEQNASSTFLDRDECLSILANLLYLKPNPPIQEVLDSGVVPSLMRLMKSNGVSSFAKTKSTQILVTLLLESSPDCDGNDQDQDTKNEIAKSLCNLVLGMSVHTPFEYQAISFIVELFTKTIDNTSWIWHLAFDALSTIVARGNQDHIKTMIESGAVQKIVLRLRQDDTEIFVDGALSTLLAIANVSRLYNVAIMKTGVMRIMSTGTKRKLVLTNNPVRKAWVYLLDSLAANAQHSLQTLVDSETISLLNELMEIESTECVKSRLRRILAKSGNLNKK